MRLRSALNIAALAVAAGGLLAAAGPASAQVVTSPDDVHFCLCKQQEVSALERRVQNEQRHHDELRNRLASLDSQLAQSRSRVNVDDESQVEAYRRLVSERERTQATLTHDETPHLSNLVRQYNGVVASYNASCASRLMDPNVLANVQGNLVCPTGPAVGYTPAPPPPPPQNGMLPPAPVLAPPPAVVPPPPPPAL